MARALLCQRRRGRSEKILFLLRRHGASPPTPTPPVQVEAEAALSVRLSAGPVQIRWQLPISLTTNKLARGNVT